MAGLIDDVEDDSTLDSFKEEPAEIVEEPEEELPEKYRGKSIKDIIAMHQSAEKLVGKQGGEVGELRKVVDEFIKTQTLQNPTKQVEQDDSDFFVDPKVAVNKAIETHPAIKAAQEATLNHKRETIRAQLAANYPNYMDVVQNEGFQNWIQGSKVRVELFTRAERNFDYDAASELLSNWQERQSVTQKAKETSKLDQERQLKVADIGTQGNAETSSKKKYRRSDIIKLMQTDPDRYEALSAEIMLAYQENRVT